MDGHEKPLSPATDVGGWQRPLARQGMNFTRARYHQVFPLGSAEGRAMAELMFGKSVIAALEKDRYGNPKGWLHTYSTKREWDGHTLEWAMLAPSRTSPMFQAFVMEWREGRTRNLVLREVMGAGADLLPPGVVDDWQVALATDLDLPDINARWDA